MTDARRIHLAFTDETRTDSDAPVDQSQDHPGIPSRTIPTKPDCARPARC